MFFPLGLKSKTVRIVQASKEFNLTDLIATVWVKAEISKSQKMQRLH